MISDTTSVALALAVLACGLVPLLVLVGQLHTGSLEPFRPDFFVTLVFVAYTLPVPLDIIAFGNNRGVDPAGAVTGMVMSLTTLLTMVVTFLALGARRGRTLSEPGVMLRRGVAAAVPWMLILGGGVMFGTFIQMEFGGVIPYIWGSGRYDRFAAAQGRGFLTIGVLILNAGWLLLLARRLNAGRSHRPVTSALFALALLAYVSFFLLGGDRRQPVYLLLGLGCVYARYRPVRWLRWGLVFVVCGFLLHLFSKVRGLAADPVELVKFAVRRFDWWWLNPAQGELGAQFRIIAMLLSDLGPNDHQLGASYVRALGNMIPDIAGGGAVLTPSQWYASVYHPSNFAIGGGVGFSFVGEAYLNFGHAGPPILGMIAGAALRLWHTLTLRSGSVLGVTAYAASLPALFLLVRTDMSSFLLALTFGAIAPVSLAWIANRAAAPFHARFGWRPAGPAYADPGGRGL